VKTKASDPAQRDAFARSSDPETSKAAAASVQNLRASHKRVLAMFRAYGDMTDETLASYLDEAASETGIKLMSPSGVRSRRSELSKPNMDRMEELREEWLKQNRPGQKLDQLDDHEYNACGYWARATLLVEGLRAPLWDTGKREALSSGRQAIVWGLAK
jgi:hypothetical protein